MKSPSFHGFLPVVFSAFALGAFANQEATKPASATPQAATTPRGSDATPQVGTTNAAAPSTPARPVVWDARSAEHLLNRAAFGGTTEDVARFVAMGQDAAIESLFPDPKATPQPEILSQRALYGGLESPDERHVTVEQRRTGYSRLAPDLILPLNKFGDWWIERMVKSEDPLRDRMAIFWHGHFVSSIKEVGSSQDMINQIQFLRDRALGKFEALVRGIGRDPAMLRYLNNDTNVKDHPNENWARELMELFSLGDGNYTETDIKQAARAFTGWSRDTGGAFEFKRVDHDFGEKRVLSVDGNLDGDHVIDIILAQPACGRFLARKIIAHLEGVPPTQARVDDYADYLRKNGYDIGKMLRRLFKDPEFYRDEIVAARVLGPIEYMIGASRRLGIDPPGLMVLSAGEVLGQRLFWPPSVKGWEGGMSWINTATMMQRSNMVGVLLGVIDVQTLMHDDEFAMASDEMTEEHASDAMLGEDGMQKSANAPKKDAQKKDAPMKDAAAAPKKEKGSRTNGFNQLRYIQQMGWTPKLSLVERVRGAGKTSDEAITTWMLDELLAIPVTMDMAREPLAFLHAEREKAGLADSHWLDDAEHAEPILRELAHLILSLPEAQLN